MNDAKAVQWVLCPNCGRKLCKRLSAGRYEIKMKKRKDVYFQADIVLGTVVCPKCSNRVNLPTVATVCDKQMEQKPCQTNLKEPQAQ